VGVRARRGTPKRADRPFAFAAQTNLPVRSAAELAERLRGVAPPSMIQDGERVYAVGRLPRPVLLRTLLYVLFAIAAGTVVAASTMGEHPDADLADLARRRPDPDQWRISSGRVHNWPPVTSGRRA
jgi:hypothetical protein